MNEHEYNRTYSIPKSNNNNNSFNTTFESTKKIQNPYEILTTQLDKSTQKNYTSTHTLSAFESTTNNAYFSHCINEALESIEGIYYYLTPIEKIETFAQITKNCKYKPNTRFGALILVYLLLSKHDYKKSQEISIICIDLLKNYECFNEVFLICCFDVLILLKHNDLLSEYINFICLFLTDINYPQLQHAAFDCLFSIGYPGVKILIEIATDYPQYQSFILKKLINTPHIKHIVIVKALVNELYSKNNSRVHSSLGALNRLYDIIRREDHIEFKIAELFNDYKINKLNVASTLRTSGQLGETILLGMLKNHRDFSVRAAICKVFRYRLFKKPNYLKIVLSFDNKIKIKDKSYFFQYHGTDKPVINDNNDIDNDTYLEVYYIEFLAALNRMIGLDYNYNDEKLYFLNQESIFSYKKLQLYHTNYNLINQHLDDFNKETQDNSINSSNESLSITIEVINGLKKALKDKSALVRKEAVISLTKIGLPEAQSAIKNLISFINTESDKNVKGLGMIALSCLDISQDIGDVINIINQNLLNTSDLKLHQSGLGLITALSDNCPDGIIDFVINNLLRTKTNKVSYAKTLLSLGDKGENYLIRLFDRENVKIQTSIAQSFSYADSSSSNFDFIIETLMKHNDDISALIRKTIMTSIFTLAQKKHNSAYLNNQKLLDYFYSKLTDIDEQIGKMSIEYISKMGPGGELLLIEGLTKESNQKVKLLCSNGLIGKGVHNIIILLNALYDKDLIVKERLQTMMLNQFYICDIKNHFQYQEQKDILIVTINDILDNIAITNSFRVFLQNIVKQLA